MSKSPETPANQSSSRWKRISRNQVLRNAGALYGVQIASFIVPLLTIPYLSRVLGPRSWGSVLFAQTVGIWVSLAIEYGFNLSASRDVAQNREDPAFIQSMVSGVFWARLLLALASGIFLLVLSLIVPAFRAEPLLIFLGWAIGVGQGLQPLWYFQATERLTKPATVSIVTRILAALCLFFLVKSPTHGWIVLASQAVMAALNAWILEHMVAREVPILRPRKYDILQVLARGRILFIYTIGVSLYASSGALLLGLLTTQTQVAYYGGPSRITSAMTNMFWPFWRGSLPTHKLPF